METFVLSMQKRELTAALDGENGNYQRKEIDDQMIKGLTHWRMKILKEQGNGSYREKEGQLVLEGGGYVMGGNSSVVKTWERCIEKSVQVYSSRVR